MLEEAWKKRKLAGKLLATLSYQNYDRLLGKKSTHLRRIQRIHYEAHAEGYIMEYLCYRALLLSDSPCSQGPANTEMLNAVVMRSCGPTNKERKLKIRVFFKGKRISWRDLTCVRVLVRVDDSMTRPNIVFERGLRVSLCNCRQVMAGHQHRHGPVVADKADSAGDLSQYARIRKWPIMLKGP